MKLSPCRCLIVWKSVQFLSNRTSHLLVLEMLLANQFLAVCLSNPGRGCASNPLLFQLSIS